MASQGTGRVRNLLLVSALAAGGPVWAQATLPEAVAAFTQENLAACRSAGGNPSLRPAYATQAELNGDGVPDYVTDLAGLECAGAWSYFCGSAGCPVTVWLSGPGGHAVGWGGSAQAWELRGPEVVLFLHGQLCDPPRVGAEGCEVALRFDAAAAPAGAAPAAPVPTDAPVAGWTFDRTADGAGWYAGTVDAGSGARLDWLCAKGRQSYLAVTPFAGAGPLVLDVDGRVQSFEVLVQNGTAYAPVSVTAPIFAHVASGAGFAVLDTAGRPVARFSMEGAPGAIGQAEGRCRV
jgi:hypothetical protein